MFEEEQRGQCGQSTGANGKVGGSELGRVGECKEHVRTCKELVLWKGLSAGVGCLHANW